MKVVRHTTDLGSESLAVFHADGSGTLVIPGVNFLLSADYARTGDDLLLTGQDDAQVLIVDYFAQETPPTLVTSNGWEIPPDLVFDLAKSPIEGLYAQQVAQAIGEPIGRVEALDGSARVTHTNGQDESLAVGDPVYQGDIVETGSGSALGITFVDGTVFSLSAGARMVLNELIFDPAASGNSMTMSVLQGTFVFITGQVAPTGGMTVNTPVAAIGVRGTSCTGELHLFGELSEFIVIPEPDKPQDQVGQCIVSNGARTTFLNVPYQAILISNPDDAGEIVQRSEDYVAQRFPVELNILTRSIELRDERNREGGGQEGDDGSEGEGEGGGGGGGDSDPSGQRGEAPTEGEAGEAAETQEATEGEAEASGEQLSQLVQSLTVGEALSESQLQALAQAVQSSGAQEGAGSGAEPGAGDTPEGGESQIAQLAQALTSGQALSQAELALLSDIVGPAQQQSDEVPGGSIPTAEPSTIGQVSPPPSSVSPLSFTDSLAGGATATPGTGTSPSSTPSDSTDSSSNFNTAAAPTTTNGPGSTASEAPGGASNNEDGSEFIAASDDPPPSDEPPSDDPPPDDPPPDDPPPDDPPPDDPPPDDPPPDDPPPDDPPPDDPPPDDPPPDDPPPDDPPPDGGANDAPTGIQLTNASVAESLVPGSVIGDLIAIDPDPADSHTFAILSDPSGVFQIADDELVLAAPLDFEVATSHSVTIRATDEQGLFVDQSFIVSVGDENEAPTDIALTNDTVPDDLPAGATVAALSASDPDQGDSASFSIQSDPDGKFQIVGNQLQLADSIDSTQAASHQVTIRATDQGGLFFDESFTINVVPADGNLPPDDIQLSNASVPEDLPIGSVIGNLSASDPNEGDIVGFSIQSDPDGKFQIVGTQLQLTAPLDFEADTSHQVTIRATDQGGLTFDEVFVVAVTNVNEAPTDIQLSNDSVPDTLAVGATVGLLSASDPDQGDSASFAIQADPDGKFQISGNQLQLAASLDADLAMSHQVTVRVTDGGGLVFDETFTITVSAGNQDPVAQNDAFGVLENGLLAGNVLADNGGGADFDPDEDPLAVDQVNGSAASVGQQIVLGSGALLTLGADGTFDYDPNGAFEALAQDGPNGNDGFSYRIADGQGGFATANVTITVTGENDPPFVALPIGDQGATVGELFNFAVPAGTFDDIDEIEQLSLDAALPGGEPLPSWLGFD
ncbi:MAG: cadherin domain-containing protein, partial [Pseudomonadota bacterium]